MNHCAIVEHCRMFFDRCCWCWPPPSRRGSGTVRVAEGERLRSVGLPGITLTCLFDPPAREDLPAALYVHGLGGSSQNRSALMPLLDGLVDEAVDLPGFGTRRRPTTATTR